MIINNVLKAGLIALVSTIGMSQNVCAQDDQDMAQQMNNPLTAFTVVPILTDYNQNIGPDDEGERVTINIQPLITFKINNEWNLISRTIIPLIDQNDIFPGAGSQSGLGDIVQTLFFSPDKPTASGWTWGVGPAFLLPTATDELLGGEKWGAGPAFIGVRVTGPWTYGGLISHISSFAGEDARDDISATTLLPFLDYTTPSAITYELISEPVYNWKESEWSVPVTATINKYLKIGDQHMQIGAGLRYWVESAPGDPEGLSFTLSLYLLFAN